MIEIETRESDREKVSSLRQEKFVRVMLPTWQFELLNLQSFLVVPEEI
jgi:hypothetical protein